MTTPVRDAGDDTMAVMLLALMGGLSSPALMLVAPFALGLYGVGF